MSAPTNTGGSAFPLPAVSHHGEIVSLVGSNVTGMTLRDYFAAKAMQGYLTHEQAANCCSVDLVASWSYEVADAMLRAREAA